MPDFYRDLQERVCFELQKGLWIELLKNAKDVKIWKERFLHFLFTQNSCITLEKIVNLSVFVWKLRFKEICLQVTRSGMWWLAWPLDFYCIGTGRIAGAHFWMCLCGHWGKALGSVACFFVSNVSPLSHFTSVMNSTGLTCYALPLWYFCIGAG